MSNGYINILTIIIWWFETLFATTKNELWRNEWKSV